MLSGNIREESMDNELEIKLMKESSDLSVFDKHPQQVLLFQLMGFLNNMFKEGTDGY
jgi:hypothetical protein